MPAIPIALNKPPIVVGIKATNREIKMAILAPLRKLFPASSPNTTLIKLAI